MDFETALAEKIKNASSVVIQETLIDVRKLFQQCQQEQKTKLRHAQDWAWKAKHGVDICLN